MKCVLLRVCACPSNSTRRVKCQLRCVAGVFCNAHGTCDARASERAQKRKKKKQELKENRAESILNTYHSFMEQIRVLWGFCTCCFLFGFWFNKFDSSMKLFAWFELPTVVGRVTKCISYRLLVATTRKFCQT